MYKEKKKTHQFDATGDTSGTLIKYEKYMPYGECSKLCYVITLNDSNDI